MTKFAPFSLLLRGEQRLCRQPLVMGILNATPDSFYDRSRALNEQAIEQRVAEMVSQGADIIDIGACSTRPGAQVASLDDELARLRLAMGVVRRVAPHVITSVDTFRSHVARVAVEELGADMLNDVSGGTLDDNMLATVARLNVPYVLMHMRGTPATMRQLSQYDNVVEEVIGHLASRIAILRDMGVTTIIADPGFGFAKTMEQNYELLASLERFHSLNVPLLVGLSRKSMICNALGVTPQQALNGTTAAHVVALMAGAHILRVHDVREAVEARTIVSLATNTKQDNHQIYG